MIAYRCQYEINNTEVARRARSGEFGQIQLIDAINTQNQGDQRNASRTVVISGWISPLEDGTGRTSKQQEYELCPDLVLCRCPKPFLRRFDVGQRRQPRGPAAPRWERANNSTRSAISGLMRAHGPELRGSRPLATRTKETRCVCCTRR